MKVVVISASPRKKSNTKIAMDFVYEYAKTKDVEIEIVDLSKDNVDTALKRTARSAK